MRFPLEKRAVYVASNSDSYKHIDLQGSTTIPTEKHVGAFGAQRKFDTHTGVDLYCQTGNGVYAMEDGIIVCIEEFTGEYADSPWWNNTRAIHVEGKSGVIVYGEIAVGDRLYEGKPVKEGQQIGEVRQVLKHDKGRPMSMLHVELYKHSSRQSCIWTETKCKSENLLDPTDMLIAAAKGTMGLEVHSIHALKTWQPYFDDAKCGLKTFDIRIDNRNYQVGDILCFQEYSMDTGYTGKEILVRVNYILGRKEEEKAFVKDGHITMAIKLLDDSESCHKCCCK